MRSTEPSGREGLAGARANRVLARSTRSRVTYAVLLLVLQVLISLAFSWLMYISPLSTAGCDDACDYATLAVAVNTFLVIPVVAFVAAAVGIILLRNRGWWAVAPPAAAIALVIVAWYILTDVANRAMLLY